MTTTPVHVENTLRLMLAGQIDLIQGCRILLAYAGALEQIAPAEYRVIAGVESETDDLTLGAVRGERLASERHLAIVSRVQCQTTVKIGPLR